MYHRALVGGQGAGLFKAIYAAKPKQQRALLKIFTREGDRALRLPPVGLGCALGLFGLASWAGDPAGPAELAAPAVSAPPESAAPSCEIFKCPSIPTKINKPWALLVLKAAHYFPIS